MYRQFGKKKKMYQQSDKHLQGSNDGKTFKVP